MSGAAREAGYTVTRIFRKVRLLEAAGCSATRPPPPPRECAAYHRYCAEDIAFRSNYTCKTAWWEISVDEYLFDVLRFGTRFASHGSSEMPIWGPIFGSMENYDEVAVQKRIKDLCDYLASLQQKES